LLLLLIVIPARQVAALAEETDNTPKASTATVIAT
jgi:hypothetical protein